MTTTAKVTALVTGASSGIGAISAKGVRPEFFVVLAEFPLVKAHFPLLNGTSRARESRKSRRFWNKWRP
jgi:hypothetical protein